MESQSWFEMSEIRRRSLSNAVWIPLYAIDTDSSGDRGHEGFHEEFFGIGHIAVPLSERSKVSKLGWDSIGISHPQRGYASDDGYIPAHVFQHYDGQRGEYLVLRQSYDTGENDEWHLGQDLVTTLGLLREKDVWVRPDEGYTEVARIRRHQDGAPRVLQVRSSHLRDYLCARGLALYFTSFRSRYEVLASADHIDWPRGKAVRVNDSTDRWEGHITEIHEGGMRFGSKVAVFHVARTDIAPEDDVPVMDAPSDDNIQMERWEQGSSGRKLYSIAARFWRNEWVEPAATSPIVRNDDVPPSVFFITDAQGSLENRDALVYGDGRWLWFKPEVIMALAHHRGGSLGWYTRDTGDVACSPRHGVHFGVNQLGLINVFAKDIGLLPDWQQRVWAAYTVLPEGGVSSELLASQVDARPASTLAPEALIAKELQSLNDITAKHYGAPFIKPHEKTDEILRQLHRFRAVNPDGLLALAKDLARVTADSLDTAGMQKIVKPPKGAIWGSLKTLENVLATKILPDDAHTLLSPLFHVYDLRLADAHLPKSNLDTTLELIGITQNDPYVHRGYKLLHACVKCLHNIRQVLESSSPPPTENSQIVTVENTGVPLTGGTITAQEQID